MLAIVHVAHMLDAKATVVTVVYRNTSGSHPLHALNLTWELIDGAALKSALTVQ